MPVVFIRHGTWGERVDISETICHIKDGPLVRFEPIGDTPTDIGFLFRLGDPKPAIVASVPDTYPLGVWLREVETYQDFTPLHQCRWKGKVDWEVARNIKKSLEEQAVLDSHVEIKNGHQRSRYSI